jgi:hypothetical protein
MTAKSETPTLPELSTVLPEHHVDNLARYELPDDRIAELVIHVGQGWRALKLLTGSSLTFELLYELVRDELGDDSLADELVELADKH